MVFRSLNPGASFTGVTVRVKVLVALFTPPPSDWAMIVTVATPLALVAGVKVRVLDWWKVLKLEGEGTVKDILDNNVVCGDGVHLTPIMNKTAAVYLCHRLLETVGEEEEDDIMSVGSSSKRSRHN